MKKIDVKKIVLNLQNKTKKYSPEILIGLGIVGMGTTVILSVQATPKALNLINDEKENKAKKEEEFTKIDYIKAGWRPYVPAIVTGIASTICIVGSRSVSARRTAALTTAYKISETALNEYREAVIESVGETAEKEVREKVYKKKMRDNPVENTEVIITNTGSTLFYDPWSGRRFKSNSNTINRVVNELNYSMQMDLSGYISLNEFYDKIGLTRTRTGDVLGWCIEDGLIKISLSSMLDENDEPIVVVDFEEPPAYDFNSHY